MDHWQYEAFTDAENRDDIVRAKGFCPLHTWQLAQLNIGFQLAIVYSSVLPDILEGLNQEQSALPSNDQGESRREPSTWQSWWRRWQHHNPITDIEPAYELCPFCHMRADVEVRLIATLVEQLHFEEMRVLLSQSTGLCLLHFSQARRHAEERNPHALPYLLECQRTCVQRVQEEVQELIRKHDYRFSDEPRGDEMTAWRRAAELCAGNPGVR
jgi:hypothetical protein